MGKIFTTSEVEEIVALADMLKQLKEFCILKYPEIEKRKRDHAEYLAKWTAMWDQLKEEIIMAKGQQRSTKEKKKPKKQPVPAK